MFHYIFDYNYGKFWWILSFFLPLETGMNTLPRMCKLSHYNMTMSPLYLVKLNNKNSRPIMQYILLNHFHRKSFNVHFLPYLLENSFSSLFAENLWHSHGFYHKFIFKLNMANFNM